VTNLLPGVRAADPAKLAEGLQCKGPLHNWRMYPDGRAPTDETFGKGRHNNCARCIRFDPILKAGYEFGYCLENKIDVHKYDGCKKFKLDRVG
jgi:hypothetical protein